MSNILIEHMPETAHFFVTMLIFGVIGLGLEVVFTATLDALTVPKKASTKNLWGYSSLWYLPLYMLAPLFLKISEGALAMLPLLIRGLIYMVAIFACEFLAMFALRKLLGASPSEASYRRSPWNVYGLIRLDFAPAMFLLGLVFEFLFDYIA